MTKSDILKTISRIKHDKLHNLKMGLAGSYARGDNKASSDILKLRT